LVTATARALCGYFQFHRHDQTVDKIQSMRFVLVCLIFTGLSFAQDTPAPAQVTAPVVADPNASGPGLYATFDTSLGPIVVRLLQDKAPQTVQNFVALANGEKPSADAEAKHMVKKRFFDGMIFHRVIRGFMIQTGDVKGTGDSNCGIDPIPDEIDPVLKFDVPGRLAMANLGQPNTAACQIFITVGPAQHLNGTFTIFGVVASGQDVADKIAAVPTAGERPITPVVLNKVTIERRDH
jgi:peptidyl-prolyl cis-trans isomerase A (cyclophilin A)